jgi:hypothetical protein
VQERKRRADSFPLGVVLPRDCEIAVGVKIITVLGVDLAQLFDKCRKAICPSKPQSMLKISVRVGIIDGFGFAACEGAWSGNLLCQSAPGNN